MFRGASEGSARKRARQLAQLQAVRGIKMLFNKRANPVVPGPSPRLLLGYQKIVQRVEEILRAVAERLRRYPGECGVVRPQNVPVQQRPQVVVQGG